MATTTGSKSTDTAMELKPFIYLYGRAEEALDFYKDALGGTYTIVARNQATNDPRLDPSFVGKVSYAEFAAPGISLAISDGGGPKTVDPDEGNIILSLRDPLVERAAKIFRALSDGGKTLVPFGDSQWGGKFGHVRDRFQNDWFILT
jgi:PhnB protein